MPDRHIGRRTSNGAWKWEAAAPERRKKRRARTLILLVVAAGILTVCLLTGVILLKPGGDRSEGALPPTATTRPAYFGVWNASALAWQTSDLDPSDGGGTELSATFLLNAEALEGGGIHFEVAFQCTGGGRMVLTPPPPEADEPDPALTSPGPGRPRPDTTALEGSIAVWGATFTEPPSWDGDAACSSRQTLEFTAIAKTSPISVIWNARLEGALSGDEANGFTTEAVVNGRAVGDIEVAISP